MVETIFFVTKTNTLIKIKCLAEQRLEDICHSFHSKYDPFGKRSFDSFIFKYNNIPINLDLTFRELANKQKRIKLEVILNSPNSELKDSSFNLEDSQSKLVDYNNDDYEEKNENQNNSISEISEKNNDYKNNNINSNSGPKNNYIKDLPLFNTNPNELRNKYISKKEDYFCSSHTEEPERFESYCFNCKKDLCFICLDEHKHLNHKIINFIDDEKTRIREKKDLDEVLNSIRTINDNYNIQINSLKNYIIFLEEKLNLNYELMHTIVKNYKKSNRNYKELIIINSIYKDKTIFEGLNEFFENMNNQIKSINDYCNSIFNFDFSYDNDNNINQYNYNDNNIERNDDINDIINSNDEKNINNNNINEEENNYFISNEEKKDNNINNNINIDIYNKL